VFVSQWRRPVDKLPTAKTPLSVTAAGATDADLPDAASLAALRAWFTWMSSRDAVDRYLAD